MTENQANAVEELDGSELGTKDYWDRSYDTEIKNYASHGDVGEVWFDEDSQIRVISWLLKNDVPADSKIIDLGCGNGMMLIELAREGFTKLTGVDYSSNAIELSTRIAVDQDLNITYKVMDLLDENSIHEQLNDAKFDIVHDKGTYDAISLHPDNPAEKRSKYMKHVHKMISDNGMLILTSCNWTEDELCASFQSDFVKYKSIPSPTFMFGGKVGNVVTQIVFKKIQK